MKKLILLIAPFLLLVSCKKTYEVERSIVIDAPKDLVWEQVKYYENWKFWSPWYARDSTMVWTFEGEDGTEGSSYAWTSENSGSGEMTNTGVEEGAKMNYHTHFMEPWESETDGYVEVSEAEGGTQVNWGFSGEMGFPMSLFMNMDKMVGPDFEQGLELLKTHAETLASNTGSMSTSEIMETEFPGQKYLAIRQEISFDQMKDFFGSSYSKLMSTGIQMSGSYPSGLYFTWDMENMKSDLAAAIPFEGDFDNPADDMEVIDIPASKAVQVDHYGSYESLEESHMAIEAYMTENELEYLGPAIEVYVSDPMMEPDTSKWLTQIIYPIK